MGSHLEAAVKAKLRAYLKSLGSDCHQYWPVPTGYGSTTVDVLICYRGRFFAIEVKRPGVSEPSARQACVMRAIAEAGGGVWLENSIDLEATKERLRALLP